MCFETTYDEMHMIDERTAAHSDAGHPQQQRIEAFCLRMLHKKCFTVSNRWYAPDLRVSKMAIVATNFSVMEVPVVFFFSLCNLSESGRKSTKCFFGVL